MMNFGINRNEIVTLFKGLVDDYRGNVVWSSMCKKGYAVKCSSFGVKTYKINEDFLLCMEIEELIKIYKQYKDEYDSL